MRPRTETLVFRGALLILMLHALDDALLHRQPGVGIGQHAVAAVAALLAGGLAVARYPALRPGLRAGLALTHLAHRHDVDPSRIGGLA